MKSENSQCKHTINGNKTEKEREREGGPLREKKNEEQENMFFG